MNTKSIANIGCWLAIIPLVVGCVVKAITVLIESTWRVPGFATSGLVEELAFALSYLTPLAYLGVGGLVYLRYRGYCKLTNPRAVAWTLVFCLSFTIASLVYGFRYFNSIGDIFRFSDLVWWLKPFRFLGA